MTVRSIKLRFLLTMLYAITSVIAIATIVWSTLKIDDENRASHWIGQTNLMTQTVLKANVFTGRERGITATLLAEPALATPLLMAEMQRYRTAVDENYAELIRIGESLYGMRNSVQLNERFRELARAHNALREVRARADRLTYTQDNLPTVHEWLEHANHFVESMAEFQHTASMPLSEKEHAYQYNLFLREVFFTVTDYAGRLRALVGPVLAQQRPFTPDELIRLELYRRIVAEALNKVNKELPHFPASQALAQARAQLERAFYADMLNRIEQIRQVQEQGGPYPLKAPEWYIEATQGVDAIIGLASAMGQHINSDVEDVQREARETANRLKLIALFVLLILVYSIYIIYRRAISPLKQLEQAAATIASGNLNHPVSITSRDELGDLARTFEQMRLALLRDITERERTTMEMLKLSRAIEQSTDSVVITDPQRIIQYVNPAFEGMTGYSADEVVGCNANILRSEQNGDQFYRSMIDTIEQGRPFKEILVNRRKNNERYFQELTITPVRDNQGAIIHFVGTGRDVSERLKSEESLKKLSQAIDHSVSSIVITDAEGRVEYVNPKFLQVSGYARDEVVGNNYELFHHLADGEGENEDLWDVITRGDTWEGEIKNRHRSGSEYWEAVTISAVKNNAGETTHYISIQHDITERKQMEQKLDYLAYYDELTGLANRNLMQDRLQQALGNAKRLQRYVAIFFLDLDMFKVINDGMGHQYGDEVLKRVASRLLGCGRTGDTVARYGGDEFVLVLADLAKPEDSTLLAQRVLEAVATPVTIDDRELSLTCSIGASIYPRDGEDTETLLRNADAAMNRSKETGRNKFQYYTAELNERFMQRLTLEAQLRRALEREQFSLHYQPQVDLNSGEIIGVEALIRWQHPELGMVRPDEFIPLAEETGLIVAIGEWVLRTACNQAKRWQQAGHREITVGVNLSGRQLEHHQLVDTVQGILDETGLAPRYLELELTESMLMADAEKSLSILQALKGVGVRLALDDFGTGYSSLSYLRRFPFDKLKVDRSFVANIVHDPDEAAIALTIIAMAQSLRLKAIAEGVETLEQARYLQRHHCDEIQGYYFSRPLVVESLEALLMRGERLELGEPQGEDGRKNLLIVSAEVQLGEELQRILQPDGYTVLNAADAEAGFTLLANQAIGMVLADEQLAGGSGFDFLDKIKGLHPDTLRVLLCHDVDTLPRTDAVNATDTLHDIISLPWNEQTLRDGMRQNLRRYRG